MENDKITSVDIDRLVIKELGHLPVQELVAELVLRTGYINNVSPDVRYKNAIKAILGENGMDKKWLRKMDRKYVRIFERIRERKGLREKAKEMAEIESKKLLKNKTLQEDNLQTWLYERTNGIYKNLKNLETSFINELPRYTKEIETEATGPYHEWKNARDYLSIWLKKHPVN